MKAQITLEVLLAFSIASIIIVWFSNFAVVNDEQIQRISLINQEKSIAKSIANAIIFSNSSNVTVKLNIPCIYEKPSVPINYTIDIGENVNISTDSTYFVENVPGPSFSSVVISCPLVCQISRTEVSCT